jgi:phospholipase C/sugar lactone lactonase YvrE
VTLFAQGNNLPLMTWYVNGIGQSGAVTIDPGAQSTIATLASSGQAYGSAVDAAGNVYVVDQANSQVIELAAGTFTESTVVASGLLNPTAVALDGAGNLYISDTGNSRVVMVPNEQGTLNSADMSSVSISGLGSPRGVATDGSGDLYVADATNGNVVEVTAGGGAPTTVASNLTSPQGIAVDAAGNLYVASSNQVAEYPVGGGTPVPLGSGYNNPSGVAVEASGAVYVADSGNAQIVRVVPGGASQATLITGLTSPQGVTVDSADNVYVTDSGNVYEVNRSQAAALVFASTNVGSTSAPQILTVSDAGNQGLTVSNLAITTNFTQVASGGTDCTSSTQLSSSGQCSIAVALAPTVSGTLTGTLTLTDNALNHLASTQAVPLSGGGLQVAQTITFPTIPTQTYGVGPVTLAAFASSGLPVSYAVASGPATVSGNMLTITGAGFVTVQASQAGNAQYAPAAVLQTFTVNPVVLTVTATSATGTYGQPLPLLTYTIAGFVNGDTQGSATIGAPSEGTTASPTSTPGMYPILIAQGTLASASYIFTSFVSGALTIQQAASTVAVTSLNSSILSNQSTTLTATVSASGTGAAPTGTVNFMLGATSLGMGTLSPIDATDSTGTLTLNGSQLAAGANSITAVYSGDTNYRVSTSTAIRVTLRPLATFGAVAVGTAAPVQTLTYNFSSGTTVSAVNILTTGAAGLDYTDGGSSSCTAGVAYGAGQSCVVTVAFTPSVPGLRSGGVTLFAQGNNLPLMTWYVNGIGQSGAVTIDPGAQSTIATLASSGQAYGSAVDAAGNVYVVDQANSQVIELAAGTFTESTVVASGLLNPTAVALDGAGNLYISDTGNSRVVMVPNEQGTLNSADMSSVSISGLGSPRGVATDGSGDLYVADATNGNVVEVTAGGGAPTTVASNLTSPQGIAVDAAGNLYVASSNQVAEYPVGGGTPVPLGSGYNNPSGVAVEASGAVYVADSGNAQIVRVVPGGASQATLITGLTSPQGVTVDSADNVYVTDSGNVYEVNRSQAAALVFASTNVGSTSAPQILTVSDAGNQGLTVSNLAITTNFTQVASGGTDCTSSTQLSSSGQCSIAVALAPTVSGTLTGTLTLTDNALNHLASTQAVPLSGGGLQVAQTITFPTIPTQTYGVGPVTLAAFASSGLPVSYAVASGPATVSGNMLTITGAGFVTVQASQAGNAQYTPATPVSRSFTVNQAGQTITFTQSAPSSAPYNGTFTVAATASSGLLVSFSSSGVCTNVGATFTITNSTGTCTVTASQSGNGNYLAAPIVTKTTTATKAAQTATITGAPATAPYQSTFTVVATSNSGITPTITATGSCSISGSVVTMTSGTGTCTVTATWAANTYYLAKSVIQSTTAQKLVSTVIWPAPAAITYPTALSATQLDATANVAGSLVYLPKSGTVLNAGPQTLNVTFTPTQSQNYTTVTARVPLQVNQARPVVIWPAPAAITYPTALSATQLDATANVAGSLVYLPKSGTVLNAGTQTLNVTFTPTQSQNYTTVTASVTLPVNQARSIVTWPTPAAITYPTALGATQLNATANVAGSLVYSPKSGTVLNAGTQTLNVTFTPTQSQNYTTVTASVTLQVNQARSIVTWPTPAAITYPTALSATQLNAKANVAGAFVYAPAAGTVLNAGSQILSVQFTPSNSNYAPSMSNVTLQVNQASQTIAFPPIPNQSYGGPPFTLNAFASSGLPISYAVVSGPATVSGNMVTTTGVGSVTVRASELGNTNYAAAAPVSQGFTSVTGPVSPFNHIVIIDQENRTPDNLFGSNPTFEPGVDIASSGINSQHQVVPFTSVALAGCYDLGHSHVDFLNAYDKGAMDGKVQVFATSPCVAGPNPQFRYVDNSGGTVQPYFDLATQYGFANRMFQTNQGPSFPSHQFLISGTSAPTTDSPLFASENTNSGDCTAPPGSTVTMIAPNGVTSLMYPCFDHATLVDPLEGAGLTWRYYAASKAGGNGSLWNGPKAISALCNPQVVNGTLTCTGNEWANVILNPAQVLTDVQNCNLANVSWVTPAGQDSDHAATNTGGGPSWVASIVNTIGNSKCGYWQNTAILITWDDWGGWYDHVPPPQIGQSNGWGQSYVYGFRVPLIVVSAYTPSGYVSNTNHDFGSLLRFAETSFGLGLIGPGIWADSYADDLMEFFPLSSPRSFNAISGAYDADHFINSTEPATDPDDD